MLTSPLDDPMQEPGWPEGEGPYLFVLEVSGPRERRLLEEWITRHRPPSVDAGAVQVAELPMTRRSAGRRRRDPALAAFLHADEDSLVVPLRVVWLAAERHGKRTVGWIDLLKLGDPRDPDPLRQYVIHRISPDRVRIVRGEAERTSVLKSTWATEEALAEGRSFVEEVAHRAWLALERSERRLRGTRYKVPKFPRENLTRSRSFQAGVAALARTTGTSYSRMAGRTRRYVNEIAATHSPYVIDLVTGGFRWLISKAYVKLDYDPDELAALYQMGQRHPLVFLPTHKSHFDHQTLQFALYENGLPPNHTAGGINMNFFPVGPLIRRSGVFFIRREFKDNEPYKFVLRQYIDYLLRRRFPLEWYIEGGRSRTGKLLPPRFGMLAYVVESYLRGSADDIVFIPVSIAYDQIQDVHSYAAEQSGAPKRPETFAWMVRTIRGLQRPYGGIYMRLGGPISLRNFLDDLGDAPTDADDTRSPAVPKLAFEIANRINEATPVTPISLITLVLLTDEGHSKDLDRIAEDIEPYAEEVRRRNISVTADLTDLAVLSKALDELVAHAVVDRFDEGRETRFQIPGPALLAAAYYRNTVVHHFLVGAIAELAVVMAADGHEGDARTAVWNAARAIRELLLFDFFFPGRNEFDEVIASTVGEHHPGWKSLAEGDQLEPVVAAFEPRRSHAILSPFLDAHRVVADVLAGHLTEPPTDVSTLVAEAMELGARYVEEGVIRSAESVSKSLFETAVTSARHRGLLDHSTTAAHRAENAEAVRRMSTLAATSDGHPASRPTGSTRVRRRR